MPGLDLPGGRREPLHGLGDALREIQPHPRGAHQNHEGHHQEERQVDAGEWTPQHLQLRVVLVRVLNAPRPRRELARQEIARNDDGDRIRGAGAPDDGRRANQLAGRRQLFRRGRFDLPRRRVSRHAVGHRSRVPARHVRRRDGDIRHHLGRLRAGGDAVHLHHLHAPLGHLGKDAIADRADVGAIERGPRQDARKAPCLGRDARLPIAVVVARDQIGGRQHLLDRRVEPAIDAVPDELAADEQHQDRRDQRHPEQHGDELSAESRERQRPPPLDDQFDHVAREHEREAEQNRQVGGPQAVQHRLGEEVGGQAGRAVRERDDADERGDEDDHARQDEPRVVTQRAARRNHLQWMKVKFAFVDTRPLSHGQMMTESCGFVRARTRT